MNKQLFSLLCLTVLATSLPSCRKRQEPAKMDQIDTMIDLDAIELEEEIESVEAKVIKF